MSAYGMGFHAQAAKASQRSGPSPVGVSGFPTRPPPRRLVQDFMPNGTAHLAAIEQRVRACLIFQSGGRVRWRPEPVNAAPYRILGNVLPMRWTLVGRSTIPY